MFWQENGAHREIFVFSLIRRTVTANKARVHTCVPQCRVNDRHAARGKMEASLQLLELVQILEPRFRPRLLTLAPLTAFHREARRFKGGVSLSRFSPSLSRLFFLFLISNHALLSRLTCRNQKVVSMVTPRATVGGGLVLW